MRKPRLAFISTVFLFPPDAGGKIRTTNVLKGLRHGTFEVTLVSPATDAQSAGFSARVGEVCDEFVCWRPEPPRARWRRAFDLAGRLPVNIAADLTRPGLERVADVCARPDIDLVVFDFVHASVLRPAVVDKPTVCFTHNVETEIFDRHAANARNAVMRGVWRNQALKMRDFESTQLSRYDEVIAVSERDAEAFRRDFRLPHVTAIPTGVDLDYFAFSPPCDLDPETGRPTVAFVGSMNWRPNIDGVRHFLEHIWPLVTRRVEEARFMVIGKNPPDALVEFARRFGNVEFTGFVDDVRPFARRCQAFIMPLLVGGGTRIKAFEAMAMGCPVVSTTLGMEGLDVLPEEHYLCRDLAEPFAAGVAELLTTAPLRQRIARDARLYVESRFGHEAASRVFEQSCVDALHRKSKR